MRKVLFLPTAKSTGTWFLIELLRAHSEITASWIAPDEGLEVLEDRFDGDGFLIVQAHVGKLTDECSGEYWTRDQVTDFAVCKADAVITPIRDPLRSLLTAKLRDFDGLAVLRGFSFLVDLSERLDIEFLPVDLLAEAEPCERSETLERLFKHAGLKSEEYAAKWIRDWPIYNTVGDRLGNESRCWYQTRDMVMIKKSLGKDYAALRRLEKKTRPFLELLGYDDLPWWS